MRNSLARHVEAEPGNSMQIEIPEARDDGFWIRATRAHAGGGC